MKKLIIIVIVLLIGIILGILLFNFKEIDNDNKNILNSYNGINNINKNILKPINNINYNENHKEDTERSIDKVSAVVKEGTLTRKGVTVIITDNNIIPYTHYGKDFYLYIQIDGKWKAVKPLDYMASSNELGHVPTYEKNTEKEINWDELYGELNNGTYLLLMTAVPTEHDYEKNLFGVEFTIE